MELLYFFILVCCTTNISLLWSFLSYTLTYFHPYTNNTAKPITAAKK